MLIDHQWGLKTHSSLTLLLLHVVLLQVLFNLFQDSIWGHERLMLLSNGK